MEAGDGGRGEQGGDSKLDVEVLQRLQKQYRNLAQAVSGGMCMVDV